MPSLASVVRLYVARTVPPVDSQVTLEPVTKLKAYFRKVASASVDGSTASEK